MIFILFCLLNFTSLNEVFVIMSVSKLNYIRLPEKGQYTDCKSRFTNGMIMGVSGIQNRGRQANSGEMMNLSYC